MKKLILQISIFLLAGSQPVHAQLFVGFKGGYDRFFDPGMNGGNIAGFTELTFGESESSSLRASLFYNIPMKHKDIGTLYAYSVSDAFDDHIPIYSKYQNAGISFEYMHYFMDDAYSPGLYTCLKAGISYSTIKRTYEEFDTSIYYLNVKNKEQFSVCIGGCLGYQFSLGANNLLFTEVQFAFPFLQLSGNSAESSSISNYPIIGISGNIGFKHSLFN